MDKIEPARLSARQSSPRKVASSVYQRLFESLGAIRLDGEASSDIGAPTCHHVEKPMAQTTNANDNVEAFEYALAA